MTLRSDRLHIRLSHGPGGQLLWNATKTSLAKSSQEPASTACPQFTQCVFYDDHRGRRILYEADLDRDEFRYILECDQERRMVFPTLRAAVFCLVGCIDRNE